jgi:hypothetical protein
VSLRSGTVPATLPRSYGCDVTFIWFVIWFIANNVGANEPLTLDPVNWWVGTLILAVALDLAGGHASRARTA